jgi:hypothetical protein
MYCTTVLLCPYVHGVIAGLQAVLKSAEGNDSSFDFVQGSEFGRLLLYFIKIKKQFLAEYEAHEWF